MNRQQKTAYLDDYRRQRDLGYHFFPDVMFWDAAAAVVVILGLIGLAAVFGAPHEAEADPFDTTYVPRPEWYFLFVFQALKYFPGDWEVVGVVMLPIGIVIGLALLPFLDRSQHRHYSLRPLMTGATGLALATVVVLTGIAVIQAPAAAEAPPAGTDLVSLGGELFEVNCASCHGPSGEGGPNPARPGDVIAPISTAEYLATRDDETLQAIIAQGQPSYGMGAFATAFGGPLSSNEVDSIVSFMRTWEADPPVVSPPEVAAAALSVNPEFLYPQLCAQCHGELGEGTLGPPLIGPLISSQSDQELFDSINLGHPATPMIAWGEVLSSNQIDGLVGFIRRLGGAPEPDAGQAPRYTTDIEPILATHCAACHGTQGGWDASTYRSVMDSGDHAPTVIPGDPEASTLAQMMRGTHPEGILMPPGGALPADVVDVVVAWIAGGAEQ